MKGDNRNKMMQNLFGDQSEDEEVEVDSEHESNRHPDYLSDEGDGLQDLEGEGEAFVEGQGEAEVESEGEMHDLEQQQPIYSENEREESSQEVEGAEPQEESEARETDSDSREEYAQEVATSRRREVVESGSDRSEDHRYNDQEYFEVDQDRSPGRSAGDERDGNVASHPVAEIRDVFGDSDDEEPEYAVQNDAEQEHMTYSPALEDEGYEKNFRPDDLVQDDYAQFGSDEEHIEAKSKEKFLGPPWELEAPLRPPPARPEKMNVIRVSNIMGIDRKPFDPKTYVEEDVFVTDESGAKKRIRLENNIVRWRSVKRADGTISYDSNARFVRWSDGSLQLLIGNEVLDISVQDAQHDHAHLFLNHGKGILQSQGRLLQKMRFMPSSLSSKSHRLLTALVDSQHKKVYKVKNCVTDVDPEREKEQKAKVEGQSLRANMLLNKKRERVNRKYVKPVERGRRLSPGFLEDALDEEDERGYYERPRRPAPRYHLDDDLETQAEKRISNAKKAQGIRDISRKSSMSAAKPSRRPVDFSESDKEEESEYETDGEEDELSPRNNKHEDSEAEYVDSEEEEQGEEAGEVEASEEEEEPQRDLKESMPSHKRKEIDSDEDSPPRKAPAHRRKAVIYDSDEE